MMFSYAEDPSPSSWRAPSVRGLWDALTAVTRPDGPAFAIADDDFPTPEQQDEFARATLSAMRLRPRYADLADDEYRAGTGPAVVGGDHGAEVIDLRAYRAERDER